MTAPPFSELERRIQDGSLVPYLGPGVLADVTDVGTGAPMPADNESLILAMNGGKPMATRLMYEFARAAMHLELKKGRKFVSRFLCETYSDREWTRSRVHDWLVANKPAYVVDINRDLQLQASFAKTPHTLVRGVARLGGSDYRFRVHHFDGESYREIEQQDVDTDLPVLFKPMGTPAPDPSFIASDADYVDYITELMGGFAIPGFLKELRLGKQYLLLGLRLSRDTERMVLSDIIYGAAEPAGWALISNPNPKERRFCERVGIEIIETDVTELVPTRERGVA